jgi:hypothetical protein
VNPAALVDATNEAQAELEAAQAAKARTIPGTETSAGEAQSPLLTDFSEASDFRCGWVRRGRSGQVERPSTASLVDQPSGGGPALRSWSSISAPSDLVIAGRESVIPSAAASAR